MLIYRKKIFEISETLILNLQLSGIVMLKMEMKLVESYINVECEEYQDGVRTIGDCLKYYADRLGNSEAIVFVSCEGADREAITWNDVYYKSVNMAKSLIALGKICLCIRVITGIPI